jgi:mRNA interferase MazF
VSDKIFNKKSSLAYVCPITSTDKGYPYRIKIISKSITGFVMVEQLKSIDWQGRRLKFVEKAPTEIMESIKNCIDVIVD